MLNARRHRNGDQTIQPVIFAINIECSTPEGIETVIGPRSAGYASISALCSTPEGIETVISGKRSDLDQHRPRVLNARRHRDGDQKVHGYKETAQVP